MNPEIEAIKRQFPIETIASTHTILTPNGHLLKGRCPFHVEKTPSFYVNPHTNRWRCFGRCATGWLDVIDFFGWLEYGDHWNARAPEMFKEVFERMKDQTHLKPFVVARSNVSLPEYRPVVKSPDVMILLDRVAEFYESELWKMGSGPGTPLTYLQSRGFTEATIHAAHLGYAGNDGLVKYLSRYGKGVVTLAQEMHIIYTSVRGTHAFFRRRIVFPDRDINGRTLHLCGRVWPDASAVEVAKYLSLKGFDKPLQGYAQLDPASDQPVFVVESPPDRLTLLQWGYDAVATLGTGLTPRLSQCLAALTCPLIYVPHNDGGVGLKAALTWQASIGHGQILALPEQIKDVNVLGCRRDGHLIFQTLVKQLTLNH